MTRLFSTAADDADGGDAVRHAIVRQPGDTLVHGLTTATLGSPDVARAWAQHAAYVSALQALGVDTHVLPADEAHPDSVFIEDAALLAGELAVLTRPGAASRRAEPAALEATLRARFAELRRIEAPGTLDAGDVLRIGRSFLVGLSTRTNREGARQLAAHLAAHGFAARAVPVPAGLHLKSGVSHLGDGTLLATPAMAAALAANHPGGAIPGAPRRVLTADGEASAANAVRVNDTVLMARGYPRTRAALEALGFAVRALDVGEFEKLDGGLSCLSLRY